MELYNRVRRVCHVEGMSRREAARLFGIDRKTVTKILQHSVPPGYRRSKAPARPKLDPFIPIINQILEEDKARIKKQRILRSAFMRAFGMSTGSRAGSPSLPIMCERRSGGQKRSSFR